MAVRVNERTLLELALVHLLVLLYLFPSLLGVKRDTHSGLKQRPKGHNHHKVLSVLALYLPHRCRDQQPARVPVEAFMLCQADVQLLLLLLAVLALGGTRQLLAMLDPRAVGSSGPSFLAALGRRRFLLGRFFGLWLLGRNTVR